MELQMFAPILGVVGFVIAIVLIVLLKQLPISRFHKFALKHQVSTLTGKYRSHAIRTCRLQALN